MKNKVFIYVFTALLAVSSLQAFKNENLLNTPRKEPKIFVNNRILARVNDKSISTFDLVKKMDLTFYRQYPQYAHSNDARYQYYEMSWRYVLEEMIDKELVLADAQESKIAVTSGDVRQEMEVALGPNIIENLDKAGLSFDEASKIMQEDLIMNRMLGGRVHAKALRSVTPSKVRQAYETFIADPANARLTQWQYIIITIKERTVERAENAAKAAYQLLMSGTTIDQLSDKLKEQKVLGRKGKVTASNVIKNNDQELSRAYKEALSSLDTGMYSQPFFHKSRESNAPLYRILFVQEKIPGGSPSFKELEGTLKEQLINQAVDQETDVYLQKLRQHYHIRQTDLDAFLPADYQPFILK